MDVKALSATAAPSAFEFCQDPGRAKDEWSGRKVSLGKSGGWSEGNAQLEKRGDVGGIGGRIRRYSLLLNCFIFLLLIRFIFAFSLGALSPHLSLQLRIIQRTRYASGTYTCADLTSIFLSEVYELLQLLC